MAKHKTSKKDKNTKSAFKVKGANVTKAKKRSKDGKTDLKKLKNSGKPKVEAADDIYNSLHAKLIQEKNSAQKQNKQDKQKSAKGKNQMTLGESINVEKTLEDFAKL